MNETDLHSFGFPHRGARCAHRPSSPFRWPPAPASSRSCCWWARFLASICAKGSTATSNSLLAIHDPNQRDHQAANDAIFSFAEYLRGNTDSLYAKENIPFEDELRHVETYLSLEKLRFEENLNDVFDISARRFRLPALTLQPWWRTPCGMV